MERWEGKANGNFSCSPSRSAVRSGAAGCVCRAEGSLAGRWGSHCQPVGAAQFGAQAEKGAPGWASPRKSFHFAGNFAAINMKSQARDGNCPLHAGGVPWPTLALQNSHSRRQSPALCFQLGSCWKSCQPQTCVQLQPASEAFKAQRGQLRAGWGASGYKEEFEALSLACFFGAQGTKHPLHLGTALLPK